MTVSRFHMPEVLRLAGRIREIQKPSELKLAKAVLDRDCSGIDAMVSLPEYGEDLYFSQFILPLASQKYLVPYFCHPYVHFLVDKRHAGRPLKINYTLILDTNFVGYIDRFIRRNSNKDIKREIMYCIDTILYHDLNIDFTLYLLENISRAHPIAGEIKDNRPHSPYQFWEALGESFKHNIISLELFRNVDCNHYQKTRELKFSIGIEEAVSRSVDSTYRFYSSDETQKLISGLLYRQKITLLNLLAVLKIRLSSGEETVEKIKEFLASVHEKCVYNDRDTIVAYNYFKNPGMIPFLERICNGKVLKNWMGKIDNLAWNITAPDLMERMTAIEGEYDYLVPLFITFDRKLGELIRCYPVKALIIDYSSSEVLPIPQIITSDFFKSEGYFNIVSEFFSAEKSAERSSTQVLPVEAISEKINNEYKEINTLLAQESGNSP